MSFFEKLFGCFQFWICAKSLCEFRIGDLKKTFLFSQNSEVAYILYNDQPPSEEFGGRWAEGSRSSRGHTKGQAHQCRPVFRNRVENSSGNNLVWT